MTSFKTPMSPLSSVSRKAAMSSLAVVSLAIAACTSQAACTAPAGTDSTTTDPEALRNNCGRDAGHGDGAAGDAGPPGPLDSGAPDAQTPPPADDAGASPDAAPPPPPPPPPPTGSRWMPAPGTSWQWQLTGTGALDMSFDVAVYDIDLFENDASVIRALHAAGRKVICYFDTAYEPGRPDSATLAPYRGNPMKGWPGQFWLDVRPQVVVDAMKARIALAQDKKCDAIEADDVDSVSNSPGTGVTSAEQQAFIKMLAAEAHARGMSYALKSDLADIPAVLADVDFDINEECFKFNECDALAPFIQAGKAVFEAEYVSGALADVNGVCPKSNSLNFDTIIKHLNLDAPRYSCR